MARKQLVRPFSVKDISPTGSFTGYASIFGELDSYRDIVAPGAFTASLAQYKASGRKVPMLWQHNAKQPIGIYPELQEDAKGLLVTGDINMDVQQGREAYALMKQGALTGLSIGYDTLTQILNVVDLWEISPVTFPAGPGARIDSVKSFGSMERLADMEDYLREVHGISQKESCAIVSSIKRLAAPSDSDVQSKELADLFTQFTQKMRQSA